MPLRKNVEFLQMIRLLEKLLIAPIKLYRRFISPLKPACCRFYPSCSEYAILAVKKYGPFKGLIKAIWRILRCNPFSKGGIDFP